MISIQDLFDIYQHVLLVDFLRYFIAASVAYLLFWVVLKTPLFHRIIQRKLPNGKKMWHEFKYSMSTVFIFSIIGLAIVTAQQNGYTRIYSDISDYSWLWFFISMALMAIIHDTYFYWMHRLMHHPKVFKHVHLVHHRSTNPSPWAAYSFHPIEAVVEAGIFPIIVFLIPVHGVALLAFLIFMITRNVWGHLGMELFPRWFIDNKWFNWNTTTTHHDMHHQYFNGNYGLYFTWWDRICGTENDKYKSVFLEVTSRPKEKKIQKSHLLKRVSLIGLLLLSSLTLTAQSPVGLWQTYHEKSGEPLSQIRIEQEGDQVSGKVNKIFHQPWQGNDPICSECPGSLKDKKVLGMTFLSGFDLKGKNGKILDPSNGKTYHSKMWLHDDETLKVRGYAKPFNLFYRTQSWKRIGNQNNDHPFTGFWHSIDDLSGEVRSSVEIILDGDQLIGQVQEIFLQPWETEDPICLACPGDKKDQKVIGMTMLWGFQQDNTKWKNGKIMDPGNGKTYRANIWMVSEDKLKIRGYLGPFYRTQVWERME